MIIAKNVDGLRQINKKEELRTGDEIFVYDLPHVIDIPDELYIALEEEYLHLPVRAVQHFLGYFNLPLNNIDVAYFAVETRLARYFGNRKL